MFRFYLPFQLGCTTEPFILKNQFNLLFFLKVRFPRKEKSKFNLFALLMQFSRGMRWRDLHYLH